MPHIYPLQGQKHTDLTQELTSLGGNRQETFRLAFAWDGEHFFEVTETEDGIQLYEKWIEAHGGVDSGTQPEEQDGPSSPATGDVVEQKPAPSPDEAPVQDEAVSATEAPEKASTPDAPPLPEPAKEPALNAIPENPEAELTNAKTPGTSTSGTNRKRSAKNSNRRS